MMLLPFETNTKRRLRSFTLTSSCFWLGSGIGGNTRTRPVSVFMVVATRKKISSKKAMSAIEPALISCTFLLSPAIVYSSLI